MSVLATDVSRVLAVTLRHLAVLSQDPDPDAVVQASFDAALFALDLEAAAVVALDGPVASVVAQRGLTAAELELLRGPVGELPDWCHLGVEESTVGVLIAPHGSAPTGRVLGCGAPADGTTTVLYVLSRDQREFSADDVLLLSLLAHQMFGALARFHLLAAAHRRRGHAEALRELTSALAATLDSRAVLEQFCSALLELTPADRVNVLLLDEDSSYLRLAHSHGARSTGFTEAFERAFTTIPVGQSTSLQQLLTGREAVQHDLEQWSTSPFGPVYSEISDAQWVLFQPMLVGDQQIGIVILEQLHGGGSWQRRHLDTLEQVVTIAAVSLQHAELYERVQRDRAQLAALHDVTLTISSSHDLASTLQHITDAGARLTGADRCRLGLLEQADTYRIAAVTGDTDEVGTIYGLDLAIGGWIMRSGQAAWMPDMELGLTEPPELAQLARRREGSALGVPLRGRTGEVIGFLSLHHHRAGHFTRDVSGLAERFAAEAVLAVESDAEAQARRRLEDQLRRQALHDPLTDLANRTLFTDRVAHALDLHERDRRPLGVLFCDLDDFKHVNDSFGHTTGDALLTQVSDRLRRTLRPGDTLARLGGDEFAVLVEDGGNSVEVGRRIADALRTSFSIGDHELAVHASIGIAVVEASMATPSCEDLLGNADIAMYEAKNNGKNKMSLFRPGMRLANAVDAPLRQALSDGLRDNAVRAAYQPIVHLSDHRLFGFEALARWDLEGRPVAPRVFIALAEKYGLLAQLTDQVLDQACAQLASWSHRVGDHRLRMGVNVSPRQLCDPDFTGRVQEVLRRHGTGPGQLVLEVTDTALFEDPAAAQRVTRELLAAGVHLSLDDFGVGYSSLARLDQLPLRALKIDRLFTQQLCARAPDTRMASTILQLARGLDLTVVAKGIETAEQLSLLRGLGCPLGQGYLLGAPAPAEHWSSHLDAVP